MDKAGDLLSFFFDKNFAQKADRYSGIFRGWEDMVGTDLAQHCQIVDIRNHVVEIVTDHPGWKQRFQFKQRQIIDRLKQKYPELEIKTVRVLVRSKSSRKAPDASLRFHHEDTQVDSSSDPQEALDTIQDDDFRASLKRLGQAIEEKNRS